MAAAGGAKDTTIEDFLLRFEGEEDDEEESGQTWQQQLAIMEAMAAATAGHGGKGIAG